MMVTSGWSFKSVDGLDVVILSERSSLIACALDAPFARSIIFLAAKMEAMPIVRANFGTRSVLSKKREFASIVSAVSPVLCVGAISASSGSLNAMCPFQPIPRI